MNDIIVISIEQLRQIIREELDRGMPDDLKRSHWEPKSEILKAPEPDQTFTIKELSNYLGCSLRTVHNLKENARIPFYRLGRKVWFVKSEIDEFAKVDKLKKTVDLKGGCTVINASGFPAKKRKSDRKLVDIDVSVRAFNAVCAVVNKPKDDISLLDISESATISDLLNVQGVGLSTVNEIRDILESADLKLKT